ALDELFNEEYEEGREDFLQFTDSFGGDARGDGKLYNLILNLYEYSRSEGDSKNWLSSLVAALELTEETDLTDTPWYEVIAKDIRLQMEDALFTANRTLEAMEEYSVPVYEKTVREDISILERLSAVADEHDFSAIADAFLASDFQRLPALKKSDAAANEEAKVFIKESRDYHKGIVKGIAENYFQIDEAEYIRTLKIAASDMGELVNLVNKFEEKYSALKRQKNILDFSDMEHFALDLLTEKSNGEAKPSAVAVALGTKFKEIMVDEYQDTNGAQEAIISLIIAGGNAKLFCVGDVKQSIYRFRLADPSLFLKKYAEYRHLGDNYDRIDLAKNFRSRGEIISGINYIFAQVMNEDTMELNYGEEEALYLGADYPQAENTLKSPIELAIFVDPTEKELEAREDEEEKIAVFEEESRYVAKRIKELINESRMVFDKDKKSYRPISYRDIVILLRSVRGKAEVMQEVLQEYDIPVYANLDGGYFEESEVRLMLALLTTLQNARQDIPLAAVLASPIGGFSFEEIGLLRAQKDDDDFFSALIFSVSEGSALDDELKSKVSTFLAKLSKWRTLAREISVSELISTLYLETGFYDYVGGLPNGLVRKENLRLLIDRAAAYEETDYRGLSRFLRFVDKIRKNSADLSSAKTIGESEDVVRIMSVHKSKGLEFPVVFMSDLGKKFNEQDTTADLLIHSKLGLGPYFTDVDASYRYPTFPRVAIRSKILSENRAEELRALYVGMTRAREKLIMTGSVKGE
ncbi:MAG: helicase-exonuclease AddAB subunit AddA, partial [Selenomonadaceae bacterium]|nr:helicase-exonuclease AddAB subunit AddA [Selenomonadaceae bacterium]